MQLQGEQDAREAAEQRRDDQVALLVTLHHPDRAYAILSGESDDAPLDAEEQEEAFFTMDRWFHL